MKNKHNNYKKDIHKQSKQWDYLKRNKVATEYYESLIRR